MLANVDIVHLALGLANLGLGGLLYLATRRIKQLEGYIDAIGRLGLVNIDQVLDTRDEARQKGQN